MSNYLNNDFLAEVVRSLYTSEKIVEICKKHLKYTYLENESQKKVFKYIFDSHLLTGNIPSLSIIAQNYNSSSDVLSFLSQIKKIKEINVDDVLFQLEKYIKNVKFLKLYEDVEVLFNTGKQQEAIGKLAQDAKEINEFALKETFYTEIFADFKQRQNLRSSTMSSGFEDRLNEKCTFGIHEIDAHTKGGGKKGKSACILARSGRGKSTWMKWVGLCNARLGARVVHFQAEGTESECLDSYDAAWTGLSIDDLSMSNLDDNKIYKIYKTHQDIINKGGQIFCYASESFESMSLHDAREILLDIESIYGPIDLIIFDYATLFQVQGNFTGDAGERRRTEKVTQQITNLAMEFKSLSLTALQANDINPKDYNNPDFCLTRHNISEFKAAIQPFSYFFTINHTDEEYEQGICRIKEDKFRDHKTSAEPVVIYQALQNGRFYDARKTIEQILGDKII